MPSLPELFYPFSHRTLRIAAIFIVLLLFTGITTATIIVPVFEMDLTQQATAIVIGTVNTIERYWNTDTRQIFTHITVMPQEVWKGIVSTELLTLKQLGGTVDNRHTWTDGSPEFPRGEKVLLFLDTNVDSSTCVAQLYFGKFSLFTERETGKEFVYRSHAPIGVHLLTKTSAGNYTAIPVNKEFYEVFSLKERLQVALQNSTSPICPGLELYHRKENSRL